MELPTGWAEARLDDLLAPEPGAITDGPFGSNLKTEHYTDAGPRVIRLQNIGDGRFRDERAHISVERFEALRKHEARPGDVIVAALGEGLPRACIVPVGLERAIVKADCIRVRLHPSINPRFVNAMLNSPQVRRTASGQISGMGRPRLNLTKIRSIRLPIPPAWEQDRIAAKVEEQFSRLDDGGSSLHAVVDPSKLLRSSVFETTWATNCEYTALKDIVTITTGSTPSTTVPLYWGEGVPFVTPGDLAHGSTVRTAARSLTQVGAERARRCRAGSVLLTSIGATIGKASLAGMDCTTNQQINVLTPLEDAIDSRFLLYALCAPTGRRSVLDASSSTTLPILNKTRLGELRVPVPSIDVQRFLVAQVELQLSVVDAITTSVTRASVRSHSLRRAILERAFLGRLVPQDSSDEPACKLLARIAADRAATTKPRRESRQ